MAVGSLAKHIDTPPGLAESTNQKHTPAWLRCSFVMALGLFSTLNAGMAVYLPPLTVDPLALPASPSFDYHRANSYRNEWHTFRQAPDIVLMGSSLMMIPQAAAEADYLNRAVDPVVNPYSTLLRDEINKLRPESKPICFNFALPGGMISDHYMIVKTLFTKNSSPKVAVLGITLRDFIDNGVDSAACTPAFVYLSRFLPADQKNRILLMAMPQVTQRGEYYLNKYSYLYGNRLAAQVLIKQLTTKLASRYLPESANTATTENTTENIAFDPEALFKGLEVLPGAFFIQPKSTLLFRDNTREYMKRFRSPHTALFENQMQFLKLTIAELKERKTQVLIVNMPLTEANKKLMPKGSYEKYLRFINSLKQENLVSVLDLNNGSFEQSDFMDTAHMNSRGGKKLLSTLAEEINKLSAL